ncbi:putative mitochondrial 3-hydroxyisobutyryl-CoA hydrolase [Coniella lustricola]|uniref:3-hydroxyisobutyryl-CoA hydrolase n=1 Tax=Coniella lustricola TaxID=2025994 RepID=A0A2T3AJK9_9PEZI|nr:putative mitochondrial 3-hydroxyisobutyryl-CoA hydrolase [Coniella lustricola]
MSPLRAKIQVPEQSRRSVSSLSSAAEIWKPQPDDEPQDVVFHSIYGLRTIELNRPQKFNALNASMIRKIGPRLIEWQKSDMANVIVMKGAGNALCAGGDVAALAKDNQTGQNGQRRSDAYFALEYKLDHLIATLTKPYIAFMDGHTMGGGVGLSIHAPFRIATERTVFAMPETTIGFFPDVGASFFLPRLPGAVGTYLALTSERLQGVNALYAGIATHYLHSTTLPMLEGRLAELRFRDFDRLEKRLHLINDTIEEYATGLPHDQPMQLAGEVRKAIDRCFSKETVGEILDALRAESQGPTKAWADKTLATLHARSPTSVHVALKQMQRSKAENWDIAKTFEREHQIAAKFMRHPDFVEGVSAQLIRKDYKPVWQPASLEDIREEDKIAEPFFELSPDTEPLRLLTNEHYQEYPWRRFGLPSEEEVEFVVRSKNYTANQVCNTFAAQRVGKQGVREVVAEIVERKTVPKAKSDHEGTVEWVNPTMTLKELELKVQRKSRQQQNGEEYSSWEAIAEDGGS